MIRTPAVLALSAALAALAACSGTDAAPAADAPAAAPAAAEAPAATGTVIEVKAISNGNTNVFEPSRITAKRGDRIRLVLESGVHNMSFPADKNPAGAQLPPATDMLQLPGQTAEIPVTMGPGTYNFQCDPHAAIGMVGTLEVTP